MIRDYSGKDYTPKQFARRLLILDLEIFTGYIEDRWKPEFNAMTKRERRLVREQIKKYEDRICKILDC